MYRILGTLILILAFYQASHAFAADDPDELYRQGKFEEAEKAYMEADIENPRNIRFRYNRGCAAFQNSDFDTAMASFSSVLRRTKDTDIRFRTFYNLGNSAFKKGDFPSAIEYYKQAIRLKPQDEDPKHNLELALRELERQKKEQEKKEQQQEQQGNQEQQKDQGQGENQEQSKDNQQEKDSGQKSDKGEESKEKGQENVENKEPKDRQGPSDSEQKQPEDLSGELSSAGEMEKQNIEPEQDQSVSSLDRNKAEAMLDNIKEDRSRFLQFQVPEEKRQGVGSGKNW